MAYFGHVCRNAGVKLTHQRLEIFREIAQTGDHPDAERVFQRIRKRLPTVSLDTVYRTLWLLKDLGLINMLASHHSRTRFDANLSRHHHFVCVECGLTEDFTSEEFDNLKIPDFLKSAGSVQTLQVEVRGLCSHCMSKTPKKTKSTHKEENI